MTWVYQNSGEVPVKNLSWTPRQYLAIKPAPPDPRESWNARNEAGNPSEPREPKHSPALLNGAESVPRCHIQMGTAPCCGPAFPNISMKKTFLTSNWHLLAQCEAVPLCAMAGVPHLGHSPAPSWLQHPLGEEGRTEPWAPRAAPGAPQEHQAQPQPHKQGSKAPNTAQPHKQGPQELQDRAQGGRHKAGSNTGQGDANKQGWGAAVADKNVSGCAAHKAGRSLTAWANCWHKKRTEIGTWRTTQVPQRFPEQLQRL